MNFAKQLARFAKKLWIAPRPQTAPKASIAALPPDEDEAPRRWRPKGRSVRGAFKPCRNQPPGYYKQVRPVKFRNASELRRGLQEAIA